MIILKGVASDSYAFILKSYEIEIVAETHGCTVMQCGWCEIRAIPGKSEIRDRLDSWL